MHSFNFEGQESSTVDSQALLATLKMVLAMHVHMYGSLPFRDYRPSESSASEPCCCCYCCDCCCIGNRAD